MAKTLRMDSLAIAITKELKDYTEEVAEEVTKIAKDVAIESAEKLHERSPKRTGNYSKGWDVREVKGGYEVYNKTVPYLTHLLEKGHAKRNGGRTEPIPHIAPVEEEAISEFEKRVEGAIGK